MIRIALFNGGYISADSTRLVSLTSSFRCDYFNKLSSNHLYMNLLSNSLECRDSYWPKTSMYLEYGLSQNRLCDTTMPDIVEYLYRPTPISNIKGTRASNKTVVRLCIFRPNILITHCKDPISDLVHSDVCIKMGYPSLTGKQCININGEFVNLNPNNPSDEWKVVSGVIESYITRNFAKE